MKLEGLISPASWKKKEKKNCSTISSHIERNYRRSLMNNDKLIDNLLIECKVREGF